MEQVRLFAAIALSILVFFVWNYFFVPPQESVQLQNTEVAESELVTPDKNDQSAAESNKVVIPEITAMPAGKSRIFTIETPLYVAKVSEKGGVVTSFKLKNYRESAEKDSPYKEMISSDLENGDLFLSFSDGSVKGARDAHFQSSLENEEINALTQKQTLKLVWVSPEGIAVEKSFVFSPDTYMVGYNVALQNQTSQTVRDNILVSMLQPQPEKKRAYGFEGPCAFIDGSLEKIKIKSIEDKNLYSGEIEWVALQDRYFISGIVPDKIQDSRMRLINESGIVETQYMLPTGSISPGEAKQFAFDFFFAPKSISVLETLDHHLAKAVNFGWFDIIAKPCLKLMNLIYKFIPNYGVAIILLTLIIKILFWPLGTKSYKSMNDMKKLQPLMTEIREKYSNDKQRMNQEIMSLYKTYKINPVSGCLPMLAQMPIFFALYRMLYEAIELRHAPFVGWITDLSAPDRLFHFDFAIPFMQAPYGIPVLTIIMGATMLLQQKMSPPAGDPAQARMMMLMPLVFTVIFVNFSSGLVLYWLVNNVLSIAQQYYISKKHA